MWGVAVAVGNKTDCHPILAELPMPWPTLSVGMSWGTCACAFSLSPPFLASTGVAGFFRCITGPGVQSPQCVQSGASLQK